MTGLEINHQIREKYLRIQQLTSPEFFVLNKEVQELLDEVSQLQAQCQHETIVHGVCMDCYQEI